jgi:hypothetical protein
VDGVWGRPAEEEEERWPSAAPNPGQLASHEDEDRYKSGDDVTRENRFLCWNHKVSLMDCSCGKSMGCGLRSNGFRGLSV